MIKNNNTKAISTTATIFTCLLLSHSSAAEENPLAKCETSRNNSIGYMRCLDQTTASLEEERRLWGNNIIFKLEEAKKQNGRGGALRLFKKSQKSFIEHAENHCRWQYVSLLPDPTSSAIKYKQCLIEMNHQRIAELKQAVKD